MNLLSDPKKVNNYKNISLKYKLSKLKMSQTSQPYIKAKFTGIFKRESKNPNGLFVFSDLKWTYLKIEDCEKIENYDVNSQKTGDYWFSKKISTPNKFWSFGSKTNILIPQGEEAVFSGKLYNVLLRNIELSKDSPSIIDKGWHEAKGDIYFQLSLPEKPKKIKKVSGVNIVSEPIKTKLHFEEGAILTPIEVSGNISSGNLPIYTSEIGNKATIIQPKTLSTESTSGKWAKWISALFWFLIFGLILFYLWTSNRMFFYILSVAGVLWLLSRFMNFGGILKAIGSFVIFGLLALFLLGMFYKSSSGLTPVKTREGNIKIFPPKITDSTSGKNGNNLSSEKEIKWFDFVQESYLARYKTSVSSFENSISEQSSLDEKAKQSNSSLQYFTRFYGGLYKIDEKKVGEIVKIFSDSAKRKNMDAIETAEMVTTFIQEIPYYLVHEGTCENAINKGDDFTVKYHQQGKPCLPNVLGGVQSPYEFLHNLKGDCDTRSLLGYTILKELNIACSVWVSEVYGHSILGVGLPVGYGIYKKINGVNHYGVELTAKGYRLGMVAPQNNNSENWQTTIYYNH